MRWYRSPAKLEDRMDCCMVTATYPQSPAFNHCTCVAENVVDPTVGWPKVGPVQVFPHLGNGLGQAARVEVTHNYDSVAWLGEPPDKFKQVVCDSQASADPAAVHGERAVVVQEEGVAASRSVPRPHPLGSALAPVLRRHVLGHLLHALGLQRPGGVPVGHAQSHRTPPKPRQRRELAQQTAIRQDPLRRFAFLEAQEVIGHWL
mmetsp:Transcript_116915/g.325819  ORF Transcript_116915/g.325819 Transcript_116915/m.325819 type:complete len:204 (-) Transcript_116915:528-1139(-)